MDGNQEAVEVVLTAADRGTGMFWVMGIPTKNFEKEYVVKSICGFISQLPCSSVSEPMGYLCSWCCPKHPEG